MVQCISPLHPQSNIRQICREGLNLLQECPGQENTSKLPLHALAPIRIGRASCRERAQANGPMKLAIWHISHSPLYFEHLGKALSTGNEWKEAGSFIPGLRPHTGRRVPLGLHEPASPHNWTDPDYLKVVAVEKINGSSLNQVGRLNCNFPSLRYIISMRFFVVLKPLALLFAD